VPDLRDHYMDLTEDHRVGRIDIHQDWLTRLVKLMDERPDYGAISLHPHVLIGAVGSDPKSPDDVEEVNMCGAVMRIMRRQATWEAGGWKDEGDVPLIRPDRGKEERVVCSRLQAAGFKTGRTTRIRAYHPFGKATGGNWGYPAEITPEMQGHNPELDEYVQQFDNMESYDQRTWMPL